MTLCIGALQNKLPSCQFGGQRVGGRGKKKDFSLSWDLRRITLQKDHVIL